MEAAIAAIVPLVPQAAWPVILVVALYLVINRQRKDTKSKRDKDHKDLDTRMALLEDKVNRIDELDLATKLASIQTDLNWIKDKLR